MILFRCARPSNPTITRILVGGGVGERCGSQSNTLVASVEDSVESLEDRHAKDEVKFLSTRGANITNGQINFARDTANDDVEGSRPDLGVGSQSECSLVKKKNL